MNQLQVFNFEENDIRTISINDEPHFVGKEVAELLGYKDPSSAVSKNIDREDKTALLVEQPGSNYKSTTTFINESGLYALIFGSQLESAKRFKRWVTSEVLPKIRKTGQYEKPKDPMEIMRLQFEALDQTNQKVEKVESDVKYLKEEVKLEAGEYSYISKQVHRTVSDTIDAFALANTKEVRSALYKDINGGVNEVSGIRTRTQLKQKHFNTVIDFINEWTPSTATLMKTRQLTLELAESEEERTAE